ncbi:hypothetical protein GCM10010358_27100 [Streptomyces minutiscleroticus]|uniref:Uncharacterized protein n=1 Tax=Streptomyces minutiscleroticus TaxID=68238 RepID=A0A918NGG2_9ACTN|nr:hypothetical protein GCM10010358_27100 [Streptomyces minutiscleroticus]
MDAVRLIGASRRALAESHDTVGIMTEAWQAQSLAQAIGSRLAVSGPPELRGEALGLMELAGRGCGVLDAPAGGTEALRAARLTGLGDARKTLLGLGGLLGEVGMALVGIAAAADDEGTYWQCMEAIDAADESRDRVLELLRKLAAREARARSALPAGEQDRFVPRLRQVEETPGTGGTGGTGRIRKAEEIRKAEGARGIEGARETGEASAGGAAPKVRGIPQTKGAPQARGVPEAVDLPERRRDEERRDAS